MTFSRSWLFAIALLAPAAALAQPALAADAAACAVPAADAASPAHHGLAFAARTGAKARIIEPDGRVLVIDSGSDLVAPSSIASHEARTAIAKLIEIAGPAGRASTARPSRGT